jgi:CheY-like chemotaxis protein
VNLLILVVDDEPDVEVLFRQQFRRDLRSGRFAMEFAQSAPMALQRISDAGDRSLILIPSDINMPGMSGLELLPKARVARPDVPIIMIVHARWPARNSGCPSPPCVLPFSQITAHWFAGGRRLPYPTFRNLCNERRLSGRGLSAKICGQPVHDTSPT